MLKKAKLNSLGNSVRVEKRKVFENKRRASNESTGTNGEGIFDAAGNKTARAGGYTNQSMSNVQEFIHDPSAVETYTVGGDTEHMH